MRLGYVHHAAASAVEFVALINDGSFRNELDQLVLGHASAQAQFEKIV